MLRQRDTDRPEASILSGLMSDLLSEMQGMRLETRGTKEAIAEHTNEVIRAITTLDQMRADVVDLKRWQEDHEDGCGAPDCPRRKAV